MFSFTFSKQHKLGELGLTWKILVGVLKMFLYLVLCSET
jgi:hypothetical protein